MRGFFPTFIGRECNDRLTTWTGLAPSPTLPLPGRAQALRFPPSAGGWRLSTTFLLVQKKRKNCSPHGQMADCFLAAPVQCPFSYCPDKHTHTCTHTPTESSFPPGKINKCKPSLQRFFFFGAVQVSSSWWVNLWRLMCCLALLSAEEGWTRGWCAALWLKDFDKE